MDPESQEEWVVLRIFDRGELAHDVTTALLSKEAPTRVGIERLERVFLIN